MIIEQLSPDEITPLWKRSQLETALNINQLPSWVEESYNAFTETVRQKDYPCFFAAMAEREEKLRYVIAPSSVTPEAFEHILGAIYKFLETGQVLDEEARLMLTLVVFFPPEDQECTLESYAERAYTILDELRQRDCFPWPAHIPTDSADPDWCYCLGGKNLFVNVSTPAHHDRRSRNLGPGLTMVIESEELFLATLERLGKGASPRIYKRLAQYDRISPHPLQWPRKLEDIPEYLHRDIFLLPNDNEHKYVFPFAHTPDDEGTDCPLHQIFTSHSS